MIVNIQSAYRTEIVKTLNISDELTKNKLLYLIRTSLHVFHGTVDGKLVCIWGFIAPSALSDQAYLWLYCTEEIDNHKFLFIRHSQRWIEKQLEEFPLIVGCCHKDNARAKKWIEWLGGQFSTTDSYGQMKFEITRKLHGS